MIVDGILFVLKGVIDILLLPIQALNIGVDFAFSFPTVRSFLSVVFYILPLNKITPLIVLIIAIFGFRIAISVIKTVFSLMGR